MTATTHGVPATRELGRTTTCCGQRTSELPHDDRVTEVDRLVTCASQRRCRLLQLVRDHDVSGVSGTGVVAYGVAFPDGTIVLRWDTRVVSTVIYNSEEDLMTIVSHGGNTRLVWLS